MKETIFRKKSMEQISSPEDLNEYIKVSNPGIWIVLLAIIVFFISVAVWGSVGELKTTQELDAVVRDGTMICYVADITDISKSMVVEVEEKEYSISTIKTEPISKEEIDAFYEDQYLSYALDVEEVSYALIISDVPLKDGIYPAQLVKECIHPIQFLFN